MMTILRKILSTTLVASLFIAGCSKNESSPAENQSSPPSLPNIVFKGPGGSASDASLGLIRTYIANTNSFAAALAPFAMITPVQAGSTWTWTYVNKTLTLTLNATNQSDGTYVWNLFFDGVDPADGTIFTHWLGIEGITSADGKTGSGKSYVRNKSTLASDFNWSTTNNILTGTLKPYINGIALAQTIVINNPDSSGEVRVYTGTLLMYKAVWQSNGSGQWWSYDVNGVQTGTGNWT